MQEAAPQRSTVTLRMPATSSRLLQSTLVAAKQAARKLVVRLPVKQNSLQCCRIEVQKFQLADMTEIPQKLQQTLQDVDAKDFLFAHPSALTRYAMCTPHTLTHIRNCSEMRLLASKYIRELLSQNFKFSKT